MYLIKWPVSGTCIYDCMCPCVKKCAADPPLGHSGSTWYSVCSRCRCSWKPGVHGLLLCALSDASAAIQAQSVMLWLYLKTEMGFTHKHPGPRGPRGPRNLSESWRSRFNLARHVLNIPSIIPALPGNHRHSHRLLFVWWPQRDYPIGWAQCQNVRKGHPKGLWKCCASTNVHRC